MPMRSARYLGLRSGTLLGHYRIEELVEIGVRVGFEYIEHEPSDNSAEP